MAHPADDQIYPLNTIVRILKTNEFARIDHHVFQYNSRGFLHYTGQIEGRPYGQYALYHDEIEVESLG